MADMVCLLQQAKTNSFWNAPIVVNGGAAGPLLAAEENGDGTFEVFWCDLNGNLQHSWQTSPGADTWCPAVPFYNQQARQMVLCCDEQRRLVLLWVDESYTLRIANQDTPGDHTHWSFSSFSAPAFQVTAIQNRNMLPEVWFVGYDRHLYNMQQGLVFDWPKIAGRYDWTAKSVTLARNGDGRLEMFYVGSNNLIYHAWQPDPGADNWSEGQLSGGARTIVAGNNTDGTITIFYVGLDGYVYHNTQVPREGRWGGDIRAFQGPEYQGQALAIGTSRNADGRLQLIYEGTDGYLYSSWQGSANGAYVGGIRGPRASAFTAVTGSDGRISQFYIGQPV